MLVTAMADATPLIGKKARMSTNRNLWNIRSFKVINPIPPWQSGVAGQAKLIVYFAEGLLCVFGTIHYNVEIHVYLRIDRNSVVFVQCISTNR
jgi:hypothetical protein